MLNSCIRPNEVHIIPALPGFFVVSWCPFSRRVMSVPIIAWDVTIEALDEQGERVVIDSDSYPPKPIFLSSSKFPVSEKASVLCPNGVVINQSRNVHYSSIDKWKDDQPVRVWIQVYGSEAVDSEITYRDFECLARAFARSEVDLVGDVFIEKDGHRLTFSPAGNDGQNAFRFFSVDYKHPDQERNDVPRLNFKKVSA